ncbi:hypothetical protein CHU98_g11624 [Xylaria longipes]|nr:hypothetical protein CHU98_g11624 [Xylaria longipes]
MRDRRMSQESGMLGVSLDYQYTTRTTGNAFFLISKSCAKRKPSLQTSQTTYNTGCPPDLVHSIKYSHTQIPNPDAVPARHRVTFRLPVPSSITLHTHILLACCVRPRLGVLPRTGTLKICKWVDCPTRYTGNEDDDGDELGAEATAQTPGCPGPCRCQVVGGAQESDNLVIITVSRHKTTAGHSPASAQAPTTHNLSQRAGTAASSHPPDTQRYPRHRPSRPDPRSCQVDLDALAPFKRWLVHPSRLTSALYQPTSPQPKPYSAHLRHQQKQRGRLRLNPYQASAPIPPRSPSRSFVRSLVRSFARESKQIVSSIRPLPRYPIFLSIVIGRLDSIA